MARSHYYSKQKLNEYFQKNVKDRTEKYYNFTYQKLVEEENQIKKKIQEESAVIKQCEKNIKEAKDITTRLNEIKVLAENKIRSEEQIEKKQIEDNINISKPASPNDTAILNGRNLVCAVIAIVASFAIVESKGDALFVVIWIIPGLFFAFKLIAYWVLKQEDEREWDQYFLKQSEYNKRIDNKFVPSAQYKESKKNVEKAHNLIFQTKEGTTKDYKLISSKKFEIVLLKKIIVEFKRLKKRASERERTAKINAFEMKNRSGAQNIKDKLLKAIRTKSKWDCPYCNNSSDINTAEADHIHPVNKGGLTTIQNMVLICKKCNSKKTNLMLRVFCKKQGFEYNEVCDQLEKLGKDV
jgi:5-methylcytosine-specific restriction endonuclease McrA